MFLIWPFSYIFLQSFSFNGDQYSPYMVTTMDPSLKLIYIIVERISSDGLLFVKQNAPLIKCKKPHNNFQITTTCTWIYNSPIPVQTRSKRISTALDRDKPMTTLHLHFQRFCTEQTLSDPSETIDRPFAVAVVKGKISAGLHNARVLILLHPGVVYEE